MAGLIGFVTDIFGMELTTLGEVSVTLGLVLAGALIFALGISVFKRAKGR